MCRALAPARPRIQLQWPIQFDAIATDPDMLAAENLAVDTDCGLIPRRGLLAEHRAGSHQGVGDRRLLGQFQLTQQNPGGRVAGHRTALQAGMLCARLTKARTSEAAVSSNRGSNSADLSTLEN